MLLTLCLRAPEQSDGNKHLFFLLNTGTYGAGTSEMLGRDKRTSGVCVLYHAAEYPLWDVLCAAFPVDPVLSSYSVQA